MDALRVFEELDDERGQAHAWETLASHHVFRGKCREATEAHQQAVTHGRAAGDERVETDARLHLGFCLFFGDVPVEEAISYANRLLAEESARARGRSLHGLLGQAGAMLGQFDTARTLIAERIAIQESFGNTFGARFATGELGAVEMLAGNPAAAEEHLRRSYEALAEAGETGFLSTVAARLADALRGQARFEEAERYTRISEEGAARDDYFSQVLWRLVRAQAVASEGRLGYGERLAREAVALAEGTDDINLHGDALMAYADVLRLAERPGEGVPVVEEALRLYEQKGNVVSAGRARALLDELRTRSEP